MATVFRAPSSLPLPDFNPTTWREDEEKYLRALADLARAQSPGDELVGETLRFPRGDGHAVYMVWKRRPLQLVWIELGDAWRVEDALIRGLRLADVDAKVRQAKALRALFSRPREASEATPV
ncbi:hypothetical protein [Marivita sp.]|jgi:hypothetical protein|uniref:hypothetical protein n=1 Tax=Marivita sp. TaxID=2003365 RepID=UPI00321AA9A3